ncbi:probable glutamate--tRNA ligase, mitochondrial isoform X2 [Daktulosphaira vitifoliae]|uniref:probable glutamate--tRNA ligase, mitochondrial isoform X2 n=1 Tax=Daktulosphaira vitifoliae TaxID=58002 RepID=UPI0021AA74CD|nr:probable glutamate--tRNA ligase, mitochondrial isoform X2 [Daktulosphaira vitifoliae]
MYGLLNIRIRKCKVGVRLFFSDSVRVRFAPSPTGSLHLGGFRTALYNYLFAKANGGKYVLRIEDTDRTRIVDGAVDELQEDLSWLGIEFDEGPNNNGPFGPYIQSERLNYYKKAVNNLLNNGFAYKCYCTEKRLELLRREAIRTRTIPRYDNKCRYLDDEEIEEKKNSTNYVVRFKLEKDNVNFSDMVYGNNVRNVAAIEGDPVVLKSDGFPTYHLANVIDDHFMKITHVLRGVEWQSSTSKHILLYRAFGWTPPIFGHLPLLMNVDGTKLSKRQQDISISSYRKKGIYPESILNFVVSCGGGFSFNNSKNKMCIKTLDELVENFDVNLINSNSCQVSLDKLDYFNKIQLKIELSTECGMKKAIRQLKQIIKNNFLENNEISLDLNDSYLEKILKWSVNRISNINQLINDNYKFIWIKPSEASIKTMNFDKDLIMKLIQNLQNVENFNAKQLGNILQEFSKSNNIVYSNFMKTLRNIISGLKQGPGVSEMMEILGKEDVISRLNRACIED